MPATHWLLGFFFLVVVLLGGAWLWVLINPNLAAPLTTWLPWPVACSTRGCVTTLAWQQHHTTRTTYAAALKQTPPTPDVTLTTLIRQHLIRNATLAAPVTRADVRRYREEILNQTNAGLVQTATGLSLEEYDQTVLLPFLSQEALRQQQRAESNDELFAKLSSERWIGVLPFSLHWDREKAVVVAQ